MARQIPPADQYSIAALKALQDLLDRNEDNRTVVGKLVGTSQQNVSRAVSEQTVGFELAQGIARAQETTLDGMVRKFYQDGNEDLMRAGDIVGWEEAVRTATATWQSIPPWAYERAKELRLPNWPDRATPAFVKDCAALLSDYAEVSAVIRLRDLK